MNGEIFEISLLDYEGRINLKVEYVINEDESGIYLKKFTLGANELKIALGEEIKSGDREMAFIVSEIIQYQKWRFGNTQKGAGQLGIYKLKDDGGKEWFAMIKDYVATEGDWRIMLMMLEESEQVLKHTLMESPSYGMVFMDYMFNRLPK